MVSQQKRIQEDVRYRVLRLLQDDPHLSQRQLAAKLGVSVGGIHYCLNALMEKGLIKMANFSASKDKRRYAYISTPKGIAEKTALTGRFLKRKMAEYEALKAEIEALKQEMGIEDTERPSERSGS